MSSSIHEPGSIFYVVQSGIVFWEAPQPAATNWKTKTLSICANGAESLWEVAAGLFEMAAPSRSWLRLHVSSTEMQVNAVQRRRVEKALSSSPPGFSNTVLCRGEAKLAAVCGLIEPRATTLEHLNSYRDTVLLGIRKSIVDLGGVCAIASRLDAILGSESVQVLVETFEHGVVCRFLDMETHFVAQFIGPPEEIVGVSEHLDLVGVSRLNDIRAIPSRIKAW